MKVDFDEKTGRLSFHHAAAPDIKIDSGSAWARYHLESGQSLQALLSGAGCSLHEQAVVDAHGEASQIEIRCNANSHGIALTYRLRAYPSRTFVLLQITLHNQSKSPIYLEDFCLIQADPVSGGVLDIHPPASGLRFLKVGWLGWSYTGLRIPQDHNSTSWLDGFTSQSYANPVTPRPKHSGEFWSEGWAVLVGEHAAIVAGFVSTARQFGQVYACTRPGSAALTLTTQLDGIRIDPGEHYDSEWGFLQFQPLPNPEPQADLLEAVSRHMHARVPASPPPPMWTHWYQFYHDISEQRFLDTLDFLAQKRELLPLQFAELDDGYQSAWGDWLSTNDRFPHGLEWLSGQVRQRGFTPGLWLAPFTAERKSQLAVTHPDWLVKDSHGKLTRTGFVYNVVLHALDLTHPHVLEHLRELVSTLTHQWDFGMLKIDFLNTAALPGRRFDLKRTRAEALRAGLQAIRSGVGEQTFLLGCGCPFGPAIGLVDAMRIGPDTAPNWGPYFHWLEWAGPLFQGNPSMPALRNALRNTLNLNSTHQRWWWNDPDCLLVRDENSRLTEAEVQSEISLIGLSGGLLISSDDLNKLSSQRLSWVSRLVPNLNLHGLPVDGMQREMPAIYRVKAQKGEQQWHLVALFNWEDHPAEVHLQLTDLGFPPGSMLHVFDFWTAQHQQVNQPRLVYSDIPAHGCKLLRVCQAGTLPQLVGDNLHISMGMEIESIRMEGTRLEIQTLDMHRRLEGKLWLQLDAEAKEAKFNGKQVVIESQGQGIYIVDIDESGNSP
jgi:alpha-galactosidase